MFRRLLEKKVCKKCGKDFLLGKGISDYCVTCLQKYPNECHMHLACFTPKCKNMIVQYHKIGLTGRIPFFHCEKLNFDFPTMLPESSKEAEEHKDCSYHTERPKTDQT